MRLRRPTTVTTAVLTAALTAAALVGCSADTGTSTTTSDAAAATTASTAVAGLTPEEAMAANADPHSSGADDEDLSWDESEEVALSLDGDSAQADGDGVTVDGSTVTISQAGTYRVTGDLTDGRLVVASSGDGVVRLVLDGASVTSSTTSALVVEDAATAVVVLADGSTNRLEATGAAVDADADGSTDEPDAALFSSADLTIGGTGSLDVVSAATDGIASKDGLVIAGGDLTVDAGDDGVRGKDYLVVTDDASVTVTAAADGLTSTNADDETMGYVAILGGTVDVTSGDDGIQAETDAVVADATVTIAAAGGPGTEVAEDASAKGIKGDVGVVVGGSATVDVSAADDGLHSNGAVSVSGGDVTLASGDDGVHADGDLTITAGTLTVSESVEGLEGATITLAGGDVDITASDDGVNAAGGTSTGTTGTRTAPQGGTGTTQDGQAPGDFTPPADGERPTLPDGTVPGDGTAGAPPAGPDGEMPSGEMPDGAAPGGQAGAQGGGAPGGETAGDYSLTISGGTLVVDAGGDGLDSNGSLEITGGTTVVQGPTNAGNGALDVNGAFTISGGTLLAAGSSGMAVAPDTDSSQGWVAANLDQGAAAGTVVHVLAEDGTTLVSYEVTKDTQNVVYSSPEIETGATYLFETGGTLGTPDGSGLSSDGTTDGATPAATAVAGEFAGGGMGGGRRPGTDGSNGSTDTASGTTTSGA
ncbi:carbohydrate-binding domain-containing protein [Oerskovia sp. KBS0722]|uniref:carbohydrate-binding domain-containing protein n=1 Tax=Oerskovia sp. KBS0722 TaxID=1179673 RepID=UPI00110E2ACF|nr:carbohydrate-binding domain-containing protein [Oerskovia sp. KBS0722]QDW61326.1 carbohydrate-binding domain-containing protein [Oerskovia sp. KBS0722]